MSEDSGRAAAMGRRLLLSCCCLLWRVASVGTARGDGGGTARGDGGGTARGGGCNNCSGLRDINFGEGKIAHTPRVASAAACCAQRALLRLAWVAVPHLLVLPFCDCGPRRLAPPPTGWSERLRAGSDRCWAWGRGVAAQEE